MSWTMPSVSVFRMGIVSTLFILKCIFCACFDCVFCFLMCFLFHSTDVMFVIEHNYPLLVCFPIFTVSFLFKEPCG
jgi:hypothetical protein